MSTIEEVLDQPIVVLGVPGPAYDVLRRSLLAAPGVWDASDARPWDSSTLVEHQSRLDSTRRRADTRVRAVIMAADHESVNLVERLPDALVVHLHEEPSRAVADAPDPEDALTRWADATSTALTTLEQLPNHRWRVVEVDDIVAEPDDGVQQLFAFLGLGWHSFSSTPWRELAAAARQEPDAQPVAHDGLAELAAKARAMARPTTPSLAPTSDPGSLTAHEEGLARLLKSLGSSLMVSTYQSDRIIVLRHDQGRLGVHLRAFDRPMGIALHPTGFALGVRSEVLDYRNFAALAPTLEPAGTHDACFLPRNSHVTGDIAVHDLAFGMEGLWVVATQFSCLATLDTDHSFVPRWQPPFISALAPEDRCHLNGVCLVDGVPRYVTALGMSDEAGGWRAHKVDGGVVMEVPSGKVVIDGLSMPHSPRWHDGRLWVLESGRGRLLVCDPATGEKTTIAEVPGFTRGLSFHGHLAFVGTSQVRETATFGGLPIESLPQRECGVWAIDTRTGMVVASVRFEDRIREIFDVAVLPGVAFPDIAEPGSALVRTSWFVPNPA